LLTLPISLAKQYVGLAEGIVFSQSPRNKEIVVKTLMKWLNISDDRAAELAYQESLTRANHDLEASLSAAESYQDVLSLVDPQVLEVDIQNPFEPRFARKLKENGELDRLYTSYGVR
jgi:hypothetical protein